MCGGGNLKNFVEDEGKMPLAEASWLTRSGNKGGAAGVLGDVATGGMSDAVQGNWKGFETAGLNNISDIYKSHNKMHARATENLAPGNAAAENPDVTAALIFATMGAGSALGGGTTAGSGTAAGEEASLAGGSSVGYGSSAAASSAEEEAALAGGGSVGSGAGSTTAADTSAGYDTLAGNASIDTGAGSTSAPSSAGFSTPDTLAGNVNSPDYAYSPSSTPQGTPTDTLNVDQNAPDYSSSTPDKTTGNQPDNAQNPTQNKSIMDALKNLGVKDVAGYAKTAMPYVGLINSALQQQKAKKQASEMSQIGAQSAATADQLMSQYRSGQLTSADSQYINQYSNQQRAQINDYYQKAGLSNSSMHLDALAKVDQQAEQMRQQVLNNMLTSALNAAGVAQGPQMAAAKANMQADQASQQAMMNFINQLAKTYS